MAHSSNTVVSIHPGSAASAAANGDFYATHARRFDIYRLIHKGLRAMMMDVLSCTGCIDCDNDASVSDAAERVRVLLDGCLSHLDKENRYVHRAMEARRPGSTIGVAAEHAAHVEAIATLGSRVDDLLSAEGEERTVAAHRLYHDLSLFVAENFQHMVMEETTNNAVLWAHYDDAEIVALHDEIVAAIPPEKSAVFVRWMLPAVTSAERAAMLGSMRENAPAPVFEGVLKLADEVLGARERARLAADLG